MGKEISLHEIRMNDGEVFQRYGKDIDSCDTLEKLRDKLAYWKPLAEDAYKLVQKMDEKRFRAFVKALKLERNGKFGNNDDCCVIALPMPMFEVARVAHHFHAPFGVALHRMIESGYFKKDLGITKDK